MKIGSIIRKVRFSKKMTIKQLAKKVNLTSSLISQIERDVVSPSLSTLVKISTSLEVPIIYFFSQKMLDSVTVIKKKNRRKIIVPSHSNAVYNFLSPYDIDNKIEFLLIEMEEKQGKIGDENELISHIGEECGYVIKGKLEIRLNDKKYYLEEGDSIYFKSTIPHRFENVGKGKSISIWAVSPPSF